MICHVTIFHLQSYVIDKINIIFDGLKKRKLSDNILLIHIKINISNISHLE